MSSAPPTPSRQPSRSSSMWKAVRRATLLGGTSKESSRPGTPASDLAASNPNLAASGSSTNLADSATAPLSKDGNGNGNNGGGAKDKDDDAASIKSGKSSKGSLAGRFLSRSGSVSSLRNLGRRKSMDTSKQQSQQPSALNTSSGGLAPPTATNPAVAGLMVPSPIAESPNREAMETAPPFVAPGSLPTTSPLAHEVSRGSEADSLPQPVSGSDRSSASDRGGGGETESPTGYVHPPLLDSAAGNPGAFTDDSDTLPQPVVIADPYGVAGRSRSRVDLSAVPPAAEGGVEADGGRKRGGDDDGGRLPNPHEQRESSLPNPHEESGGAAAAQHEEGVGATRGLEGGPSVSAVSTEDYGVEVERAGGREAPFLRADTSTAEGSEDGGLVESPASHTGFAAAVESHAALARGKGEESEGYGYGSGMRDGKGVEERGREPTLPAYSETGGQGEGQWDGTPLDNPFVDLQSQPRSAYQPQVAQPQVFQSPPFAPISQPQAQYPTQGQPQYHDDDDEDDPEQDSATKRAYALSPPVPQNTLANVPPQWPVEEHIAANPQWDDVESPTRVLRSDSPPQIPDSFDELRGREQPLGQSQQGGQEGYGQRQGTQGSEFYVPPPSPPPVERRKGSMGGLGKPQPQHPTTQVMPIESHRDEHPTILMPLPPFNSVVAAQPLVQPSTRPQQVGYETDESRPLLGGGASTTKPPIATYGIRPADSTDSAWVPTASSSTRAAGIYSLPRRYGSTTSFRNYDSSHGQPRGGGATLGVGEGYGPNVNPKLHDLGWVEYHLPDGTFYYVHPTLRVTTDVNLRNERLLDDVTDWLDMNPPFGTSGFGAHPGYGATDDSLTGTGTGKRSSHVGAGVEVWLRDAKGVASAIGSEGRKRRRDTGASDVGRYVRCWVDHQARTIVLEKPSGAPVDRKGKGKPSKKGKNGKIEGGEEEDELDMSYRYWSFMEAHPAHMVLSPQSRNEALEVLTWAYTDRILPSQKPVPPPFGPSECDELRKLINSFPADSPDDNGIQTRVVSRVLLRVASWRQAHFRSHKPLPKDVKPIPPTSLAGRRASAVGKSVLRLVWDLFVVLVCLGLPYIFVERKNRDEEGWHGELRTERSGGSVFAVGVISCLVSAVILSASVTFLALPGMTGAARIAGFVAISCAVGSMLASTIAFVRFRNEFSGVIDRTSVNHRIVGGEGLAGISNRAVVNSLPLVFVAYSIIGFVVGLSIYSFRGTDLEGPSSSSPADSGLSSWVFGQGAKWSALGLLGAAGGVVAMSWVVWQQ